MNNKVIEWILQDDNPAVKYRCETEILGLDADNTIVKDWIIKKIPEDWFERKGLWYIYYIVALAECGLTYKDLPEHCLDKAIKKLEEKFNYGCEDFMCLTALLKLGLKETVEKIIYILPVHQLPDGGFLCTRRKNKLSYIPKSCYKANLHALLFITECHKKGIETGIEEKILNYFWEHKIFYKSSDNAELILDEREGWRTIDVFHPFEVMRVGIHNVVEAFSALGYGNDIKLKEAWDIFKTHKDEQGKIVLDGTLNKPYLPKEKIGKPSKWATFYMILAEKERSNVYEDEYSFRQL